MIIGTGIDIAKITRFKRLVINNGFMEKFFPLEEIEYINSRGKGAAYTLAGRFAAREAFFKALGTGFTGFSPKDITVLNNENGRPYIIPSEKVKKMLNELGDKCNVHLSISHEKEFAVAQVILEV